MRSHLRRSAPERSAAFAAVAAGGEEMLLCADGGFPSDVDCERLGSPAEVPCSFAGSTFSGFAAEIAPAGCEIVGGTCRRAASAAAFTSVPFFSRTEYFIW